MWRAVERPVRRTHEVSWLVGAMHLTISETATEDNL